MADITIVNGVYKPTYNWGAPSCIVTGAFVNQQPHHPFLYGSRGFSPTIPCESDGRPGAVTGLTQVPVQDGRILRGSHGQT